MDKLDYSINIHTKEIVKISTETILKKEEDCENIKSFVDLLTDEQKAIVLKIKESALERLTDFRNILKKSYRESDMKNYEDRSTYFTEYSLVDLLLTKYTKWDWDNTFIELIIVFSFIEYHLYGRWDKILPIIRTNLINTKKIPFDKSGILNCKTLPENIKSFTTEIYNGIINKIVDGHTDIFKKEFRSFYEHLKQLGENKPAVSSKKKESNCLKLHIKLESKDKHHNNIMENFLEKIYRHSKKVNDKIKIFYLATEYEKNIVEKPNPEYEAWQEKKNLIESMKSNNSADAKAPPIDKAPPPTEKNHRTHGFDYNDIFSYHIPRKTIPVEEVKQKITSKQLNELSKSLDTLYLRKQDKERLISALTQFRDKKDLIKELGLPNKLNILLHGLPGTGKSTTIQAVATFLKKDIYYVDIKDAKTNQDLQAILEYVNKSVGNGGGIVVFEDIDVMTNVVLKRQNEIREYKVNEIINNKDSAITLEYLLNILQGTLTMDDSVCIVTTNHLAHLDPAFYRAGRFDVKIEMKLCDRYQIQCIYQKIISREVPEQIIRKIPEDKFSPATVIFDIKNYIFDTDASDDVILHSFIELSP